MEDHRQDPNSPGGNSQERSSEPVRSRWTPKPEQILILESIFNSGMVNPPKDETVRIRKLLEKFGAVGDANVFYWFQNRRSRSRRRQRQMQAASALAAGGDPGNNNDAHHQNHHPQLLGGAIHSSEGSSGTPCGMGYAPLTNNNNYPHCLPTSYHIGSSSSTNNLFGASLGQPDGTESFFSIPGQVVGFPETDQSSMFCPSETSSLPYQSGN
ncbi:hypothetical protein CDL15_Pgr001268 [Punica granatum]|uniref:Homeobox domain-containing protein n=1 Tax=Punica granatum TaxID=22663 RepID=A0A218WJZ3_PUNGR|nr:hypothetical protein CDL15_Pgr001268 [Punica granatum]